MEESDWKEKFGLGQRCKHALDGVEHDTGDENVMEEVEEETIQEIEDILEISLDCYQESTTDSCSKFELVANDGLVPSEWTFA